MQSNNKTTESLQPCQSGLAWSSGTRGMVVQEIRKHLLQPTWRAGGGRKLLHPAASVCPRPGCGPPTAPVASRPAPHGPCCCAAPVLAAAVAARCLPRLPAAAAWPASRINGGVASKTSAEEPFGEPCTPSIL